MQTFQPNAFIPAMLIGTIDYYHPILPLMVTLIFAVEGGGGGGRGRGYKVI